MVGPAFRAGLRDLFDVSCSKRLWLMYSLRSAQGDILLIALSRMSPVSDFSVNPFHMPRPFLFTQYKLLNFSGRGFREFTKDGSHRTLEVGHLTAAERQQLMLGNAVPGF